MEEGINSIILSDQAKIEKDKFIFKGK